MKFQPYIWELYKQSEQGKKAIARKKENFDSNNYQKIYWEDLKNPR